MSDEWEWLIRRKFRFSSWKYFLLQIKIFFIPQPWPRGQRRESWWVWLSDWGLVGLGPVWVRSPFHPSAHGWLSLTGMTISPPNHQPVRYTQTNTLISSSPNGLAGYYQLCSPFVLNSPTWTSQRTISPQTSLPSQLCVVMQTYSSVTECSNI